MRSDAFTHCCERWSFLSREFNSGGRRLEAATEVARCVRTGDGDTPSCRFRNRLLVQMVAEGYLTEDYREVHA